MNLRVCVLLLVRLASGAAMYTAGFPIIVVGMPKCGTTSLADYFRCGNLRVSHHDCPGQPCGICVKSNAQNAVPLLQGCGEFEVYAQLDVDGIDGPDYCYFPQIELLDGLLDNYPNATLVLNVRPVRHWIDSVNKWNNLRSRLVQCEITGLPSGHGAEDNEMELFFHKHVERVFKAVSRRHAQRFVLVDIESPYASHILEHSFRINRACWGKSNRNPGQLE